jgi:hypothetical protein
MINRRSGVKMFLSLITAPIVLAHLIDFLIRRCYVNPLIHPANLIRHAYSRYKKDEALKKLAALHVFVKTSPINKAVTSGKGNRLFTG